MSDTKKNALAELAERLGKIDERYPLTIRQIEDVDSAQRIIAELAKVSDWHWQVICDDFCTTGDFELHCAIGRCLAIAEEGSRDEGK